MKNLKLYYVSDKYIEYLRMFDTKVAYNKRKTRPYVGIVCRCNDCDYFVPLASPKPKHLNINSKAVDIYKIKGGELGVLNINNMIPVNEVELTEVLPTIQDEKYKILLQKQITCINNDKSNLYKKITFFMHLYYKGNLSNQILQRCCNFPLLEEKKKEYLDSKKMLE